MRTTFARSNNKKQPFLADSSNHFKRRLGYSGWLDTEMGTSSTADHAMDVARKLSLENSKRG